MIHVLDTTAFSAAMRGEEKMIELLRSYRPGDFAVAPPVVAEIEYGIQRSPSGSRKRELLEEQKLRFLDEFRMLPWNEAASRHFGATKSDLERRGELIDDIDIAIAAIALAHEAEVITANLMHFQRVSGLKCRHWVSEL